jgi:hypothetical protein
MGYPDRFIRGVADPNFIDDEGRASAAIFQFDYANREDGFYESSINWYDNENALSMIMEQRKENDEQAFQFRYGAAVIERYDADRIIKNTLYRDVFQYERAPIDSNQYHGNLLRKDASLKKTIRSIISSSLALNARLIPRATENN